MKKFFLLTPVVFNVRNGVIKIQKIVRKLIHRPQSSKKCQKNEIFERSFIKN